MHDIFSTTVDAAEILIPQLKKQGYEMVTVHELAKRNGIQLGTGTTYSDLKSWIQIWSDIQKYYRDEI